MPTRALQRGVQPGVDFNRTGLHDSGDQRQSGEQNNQEMLQMFFVHTRLNQPLMPGLIVLPPRTLTSGKSKF
jgi:hypothetical protein